MIFVDPATISIPNYATTAEEAEELFIRLKHFADAFSTSSQLTFLVADELELQLGMNHAHAAVVKEYLELFGLSDVYDSKDILRSIQILQHKATRFSDWDGRFKFTCSAIQTTPLIGPGLAPVDLVEITRSNVLLAAVSNRRGRPLFLTSALPEVDLWGYSVSAENVTIEDNSVHVKCDNFEGIAATLSHLSCLVDDEIAETLWMNAKDSKDLAMAIFIGAVSTMKRAGVFAEHGPSDFIVGSDFFASLAQNQASAGGRFSGSVARTCFDLAAGCFSGHDRPFGVRGSDGAEGRRCHATKGKVALRLMYWRTNDLMDFSLVGPKKDLKVAGGLADNAWYFSSQFERHSFSN